MGPLSFSSRYLNMQPRFQGSRATQYARNTWCGNVFGPKDEMERLKALAQEDMSQGEDACVGEVPQVLMTQKYPNRKSVVDSIERMTDRLQTRVNEILRLDRNLPVNPSMFSNLQSLIEGTPFTKIEFMGRGGCNCVFKLWIGKHKYALRISANNAASLAIANTAYVTLPTQAGKPAHRASDVANLVIGNPLKNWVILEFIDQDTDVEKRPGVPLETLDFRLGDSQNDDNTVKVRGKEIIVDPDVFVRRPSWL